MPRYRSEADLPLSVMRGQGTIPGQIVDQIRSLVAEGRLRPGDPLPSSRTLATRIGVSRGSVTSAYDQLAVEGYLEADRGSTRITTELSGLGAEGFTGNNPAAITVGSASPRRGPHAPSSPASGRARTWTENRDSIAGVAEKSRDLALLDLRPGTPDTSSLANTTWRAAWRAAAADPSLGYEPQGSPHLRNQLSEYLRLMRSVIRSPDDLLVTAGARDGLRILLMTLHEREGRPLVVAVEDPGYPSLHKVPQALGHRIVPIPLDDQGLDPARLPSGADRPDVVLVTPSHQYPMGASMPAPRRLELIQWAAENRAILVEDDYDSELRYVGDPLPALAALDEQGTSVVTLGSFAKVLTPGLGLGYLLMPSHVRKELVRLKGDAGPPVSGILQDAMTRFMADGGLQRHTARMRRSYRRRRDMLATAFDTAKDHPGVEVLPMDGGLHAVIRLPTAAAEEQVIDDARRRGVAVGALGTYWSGGSGRAGVVVGFGGLSEQRFERGLTLLRESLERCIGEASRFR